MGARGLKTKIALNITFFLFFGMLSIDFVTMMTAQRNLIRSETAKGRAIARLLAEHLALHPMWEDTLLNSGASAQLAGMLETAGVACLLLLDTNQRQIGFGADRCDIGGEILTLTQQAMASGLEGIQPIGSTFGFFWVQKELLVISTPLRSSGEIVAALSLVLPLDGIYQSLRQSQQMLFVYIFLNTAILAFLGIYRVFKLYLQPLARLAKRAEDYKEEDAVLFSVRKEDNELQRLSAALNSLLRRLSAEKEKLRDTVSSLETANIELKKAQTEVIRAEKLASVGRLSAGIAHEIGNPIGIVTGYLELLKQRDIPQEERVEYLDRAGKEIERISTIIRQLLDISRPSPSGSQRVSVHALLEDLVHMLNVQPFMSHVRTSTALEAAADEVAADPNQLRQVFLNLVINAADAISANGPEGRGELVISSQNPADGDGLPGEPQPRLQIHFSDTGIGIPAENLSNLFDPFFTTKEPGKGTGLGLSVSFMIIESFGGKIQVESEPGKGTLMTVSLPTFPPAVEVG